MKYLLNGLVVQSEVALNAPLTVEKPDLVVTVAEISKDHADDRQGEVMAELMLQDQRRYTAWRTADGGSVLRVHGLCDFEVNQAASTVYCVPTAECKGEYLAILLGGLVISFILTLNRRCVLHGSAVAFDDRALGFVGASGGGKSTLAVQMCLEGGALVTDDVLPLAAPADGVVIVGRASELRLRSGASELVERLAAGTTVRSTADNRLAVAPRGALSEQSRLHAIVLPRPFKGITALRCEQLVPTRALFELARHLRVAVCDSDLLSAQFEQLSEVVARVAVYSVDVPWGPPFQPEVPRQLLLQLGLA